MAVTTVSSRELNQDVSRAKRAAEDGPVVITDRGKPSHVLMSFAEYERLAGLRTDLVTALSMQGLSEIAFEPERASIAPRAPELD